METGIILSQTDLKKLLAKLLKVDEKQIVQSKYSFMIMGINHQTIDDKYKKRTRGNNRRTCRRKYWKWGELIWKIIL